MISLTNEMILENLNNYCFSLQLGLLTFGAIFLILIFIGFIVFITEKNTIKKNTTKILIILITLIFPLLYYLLKYSTTSYSIKNNSWYVVTDSIEQIQIKPSKKSSRNSYYVYLKENGKVSANRSQYSNWIFEGDSVYVIIVKGRFSETFVATPLYPTKEYLYKK